MALLGMLTIAQAWFLPGFLFLFFKKIKVIDKIIISLLLSLVLNYLIIYILDFRFVSMKPSSKISSQRSFILFDLLKNL